LSGCATVPMATAPLNQPMSWQQRQAQVNKIQDFQAEGIIGIRYQQRAQSANIHLIQHNQRYHLQLSLEIVDFYQ
jgi:outer membrane biogenesis lipoprotein LolB